MQKAATYRVGSKIFSANSPEYEKILKYVHENKIRPHCMCGSANPEMYVAKFGGQYIIKRLPGTGHLHDHSCPTFDPPLELTGLGQLHGSAIATDSEGGIILKFGFPMSKREARAQEMSEAAAIEAEQSALAGDSEAEEQILDENMEPEARTPATSVKAHENKLNLLSTLHYLWDAAELTKHRSSWTGKRNWFIVRRELMGVVVRSSTKRKPLSSLMFIPQTFRLDRKDQIDADRNRFMARLISRPGKPAPLGIVVGMLKRVERKSFNYQITLKHLPEFPLYINESATMKFKEIFGEKIAMSENIKDGHFIVIATFVSKGSHGIICEISGMPVNSQFLPFENFTDLVTMEAAMGRRFIKCLRYNLGSNVPIANLLLVDTETPTAIYSPDISSDDPNADDYRQVAATGNYTSLLWFTDEDNLPSLPEATNG